MQQILDWLKKLGMSEYAEKFAENDIDMAVLPDLTDQHLKELGVSLGHRLKMLRSIRDLGGASAAVASFPVATELTRRDGAERRQLTIMFCGCSALPLSRQRREASGRKHLSARKVHDTDTGGGCRTSRPDFGGNRRCCASGGFELTPAHSGVFSTGTRSPSKKHCKRRSGSARTLPTHGDGGSESKACLILSGWYFDETAVSTNLARLRGRAPRGIRVIGHVPLGTWKTITFVAALRHNKIVAPMVVEGAMNGEMFLTYVQECLAPTLRRGDIVVMDNLQAHKVAGIEEAIESRRATLRYLPKYSPDLHPIELVYNKFKALLRKVAARTVPALVRTIRSFVPLLGTQECTRYLSHAGYPSV